MTPGSGIMLLCLNVSSSTHNCVCVVDGSDVMAEIYLCSPKLMAV